MSLSASWEFVPAVVLGASVAVVHLIPTPYVARCKIQEPSQGATGIDTIPYKKSMANQMVHLRAKKDIVRPTHMLSMCSSHLVMQLTRCSLLCGRYRVSICHIGVGLIVASGVVTRLAKLIYGSGS